MTKEEVMVMIDANAAMEAATEGAKAANKFQEILLKIFGPKWTRKQADADAYADERKLQLIRDNPDMEIMYVGDEMHARERSPEALAERAQQRQLAEAIRQEDNLENVLKITSVELQSANTISNDSVDDDWLIRLFSIVKDVNSEEMQYLWGKILAGEIISPGSFSLRTLETVRNMNRKDAETFQKVLPLIVRNNGIYFISSDSDLDSQYGVSYYDILVLDECGLMNSSGTLSLNLTLTGHMQHHCESNERIVVFKSNDAMEKKISFGIYTLTNAGIELYNILQYTANNEYFLNLAKHIWESNKQALMEISVHEINSINDGAINYKREPIETFLKEN